jgi:hypothetical protein
MWRGIGVHVCQNQKVFYTYVLFMAFAFYNSVWHFVIGLYRRRNYHRSLPVAIQREKEWDLKKPKDEDDDEDEEEEEEEVATTGGDSGDAGEGGDAEEE